MAHTTVCTDWGSTSTIIYTLTSTRTSGADATSSLVTLTTRIPSSFTRVLVTTVVQVRPTTRYKTVTTTGFSISTADGQTNLYAIPTTGLTVSASVSSYTTTVVSTASSVLPTTYDYVQVVTTKAISYKTVASVVTAISASGPCWHDKRAMALT